jgi:hypothetical protein
VHGNYVLFATFVSREMFMFHAMLADSSESSMIILSDCDFCGIHGNKPCYQTSSMFEWHADSNTMPGFKIQMITLITFLNDKIAFQEYIYGAKCENSIQQNGENIPYIHDDLKNNAPQ